MNNEDPFGLIDGEKSLVVSNENSSPHRMNSLPRGGDLNFQKTTAFKDAHAQQTRKGKAELIDIKMIEFEDNFGLIEEHFKQI